MLKCRKYEFCERGVGYFEWCMWEGDCRYFIRSHLLRCSRIHTSCFGHLCTQVRTRIPTTHERVESTNSAKEEKGISNWAWEGKGISYVPIWYSGRSYIPTSHFEYLYIQVRASIPTTRERVKRTNSAREMGISYVATSTPDVPTFLLHTSDIRSSRYEPVFPRVALCYRCRNFLFCISLFPIP